MSGTSHFYHIKLFEFRKAFLLISLSLLSLEILATPPCGEIQYQAAPVSSQRDSGAFSVAANLSCYSGEKENYITNTELLEDALLLTNYFCNTSGDDSAVNSPNNICYSHGEDYFFKADQFPELFSDFIEMVGDSLNEYPLTQEQKEGLSDDEQRALKTQMFLCTQHFGKRHIDIILTPAASTEEKLKAIKSLKDAGLLILLEQATTIEEILAINHSDPQFIEGLIEALLTEPSANDSVKAITALYKDLRLKKSNSENDQKLNEQDEKFLTLFTSTTERLQGESNIPDPISHHLFANDILAQSATSNIEVENTSAGGEGGRAPASALIEAAPPTDQARIGQLVNYPSCNELPAIDPNNINHLKSIFDDRIPNYRENHINRYEHLLSFLSDELDYQRFISFLLSDNSLRDMLPIFESYYCHLKEIEKQSRNISSMSQSEANQFFDFIEDFDGADSSLSLIPGLFNKVNKERQDKILTYLGAPSPNEPMLEEWKANSLYLIYQNLEVAPDTSQRSDLMSKTIASLGTNSGAPAESMLAQIFKDSPDEKTRSDIINAYQNSAFARFGGNLRIFFAISSLPRGERKKYALLLRDVVKEHFVKDVASGNAQGGAGSLQANALQVKEALDVVGFLSTGESLTNPDRGDNNGVVLTSDGTTYELPNKRPYAISNTVVLKETKDRKRAESSSLKSSLQPNNQQSTLKDKLIQPGSFSSFKETSTNNEDELTEEEKASFGPSPYPQVLNTNQQEFLNGLTNNINSPVNIPEAPRAFSNNVGENNNAAGNFDDTFGRENSALAQIDDFSSQTRQEESENSKSLDSNEISKSGDDSNSELLAELKDINEAKDRLKERINRLDTTPSPSLPGTPSPPSTGRGNTIASSNRSINNFSNTQDSIGAPTGRRPASRGPASIAEGASTQAIESNPYSTGSVLSPYTEEEGQVDNNLIIKVLSEQEKVLLRDYMTAKDQLSCPELRFIQNFYERNIDKFILTKKRKPWREYAIIDLEGMTFRLNYPGGDYMDNDIQKECNKLVKKPLEIGERVPASLGKTPEKQKDVQPADQETGFFKSLLYKIGL